MINVEDPFFKDRECIDSVQQLIDRINNKYSNEIFCSYLVDGKLCSKTYSQMFELSISIGAFFYNKLKGTNRHVALIGDTSFEWLTTYIGLLYYGVVVVPLDRLLDKNEILNQIDFADVEYLVYDNKFSKVAEHVYNNSKNCRNFINFDCANEFSHYYYDVIKENIDEENLYKPQIDVDKLAEIVFTSGTTGTSKGVMISHRNKADSILFGTNVVDYYPEELIMTVLPNNHVYLLTLGVFSTIYFGMTLGINDNIFNLSRNFNIFKPASMLVVPSILHVMKKEILANIKEEGRAALYSNNESTRKLIADKIMEKLGGKFKSIVCGGAFLDQETIDFFEHIGIQIVQGYGITECSPLVASNVQEHTKHNKKGTVGKVGPCCKVKCVDGEIWVSGSNVMMGYYKNPEFTAEVMEDGWFKTGDLGFLDEDNYMYLTGRKKNLIILSNGENVSPEEIEGMYLNIEIIDSVIVYSENEMIVAEVYPNKEYIKRKDITDAYKEVKREIFTINKKLPKYKQVQIVKLREKPFEKTTTMKIKRNMR